MLESFNPEKGREVDEQFESPQVQGLLLTSVKHKIQRDGFCLWVRIKEEFLVVRVVVPLSAKWREYGQESQKALYFINVGLFCLPSSIPSNAWPVDLVSDLCMWKRTFSQKVNL